MIGLLVFLLLLWIAFVVIGFAIKTLFWLAIVGIVLFIVTVVVGFLKSVL